MSLDTQAMKTLHKPALFDMDNSLVDYDEAMLRALAEMQMPGDPDIADMFDAEKRYKHIAARIRVIKAQPGWWLNLKPIPAGMRIFRAAARIGFTNMVATKGPAKHPAAWGEKRQWCHKYLGVRVPVTVTDNKSVIDGEFLYDDFPPYAVAWLSLRPHAFVIMPQNEGNKSFSHPRVLMWTGKNFAQVKRAMQRCYDAQPGESFKLA